MNGARRPRFHSLVALSAGVVLLASALVPAQSSQPTTRRLGSGGGANSAEPAGPPNPIPAAVTALLAEFKEAQAPNRTLPRKTADYFAKAPVIPTADQVWQALDRTYGGDVRADAYVKWQLLSALPSKVDDRTASRVAAYLQRAPKPTPNPLLDPRQRSEIEALGSRARPNLEGPVNERIQQVKDTHFDQNRSVVGLRDDLLRRLPEGPGRYVLSLDELAARAKLGLDITRTRDRLVEELTAWASSAPTDEVRVVFQTLGKVRGVESEEVPVRLRTDGSTLKWDRGRVRVESWDRKVEAVFNKMSDRLKATPSSPPSQGR